MVTFLKKVLALVLVVATLMSFATIAGAAKFTDGTTITKTEAVDVMTGLGIVKGFTDGSFKPTANVTRAEMAKMVSIILAGGEDVGALYASANTFTDCNSHWAKGYIAYAAKTGIVAGVGKGKFNPQGNVTGVQAAKMLLVALKYNPGIETFTGENWSVNVLAKAKSAGLLAGIEKIDMSAPLTREQAAQMMLNALKGTTVYYANPGSTIVVNGMTITQGASAATPNLWVGTEGVNYETGVKSAKDETVQLCEDLFPSLKKTSLVSNGVNGFKWSYKGNEISGFVSGESVLATTFKGANFANLTTKGNTAYIGYKYNDVVQVYVGGEQKKTDVYATGGAAASDGNYVMADTTATTGDLALVTAFVNAATAGQTVSFIDTNDDSKFDKISITTYLFSKVTNTAAAKADGTEATVTIAGVGAIKESLVSGKFADLAKDDYVMIASTKTDGVATYIVYEAENFVGKMTRYNTGDATMTIDGTVYSASTASVNNTGMTAAAAFTGNKESKFYKDANGLIVAVDGVNAEAKYAIIDSIAYVPGSGATPQNKAEAKLIFNDATTKVVTLNYDVIKVAAAANSEIDLSAYDNKSGAGGTALSTTATIGIYEGYEVSGNGTSLKKILVVSATAADNAALAGSIYTYTTNTSDAYTLKEAGNYTATANKNLTKGSPMVDTGVANNATVFIYKTKNGTNDVFTAYTGYKNVPSTTGTSTKVDYVTTTAAGMVLAYVDASGSASIGDSTSDVAYFWNNNFATDNSGNDPLYEYEAILNGEKKTLVATTNLSVSANTLYKVTLNDKGQATAVAACAGANYTSVTANGDVSATSGIITIDSATLANGKTTITTLAFDDSTLFYAVSKDGKTVSATTAGNILDNAVMFVKTKGDRATATATPGSADNITATVVYILVD